MAATRWAAAEAKFRENQSALNDAAAVSLSAWNGSPGGPMGTDIGACVDLKDGRWLWLFGDTWMPTAAGQNTATAAGSGWVSNCVMLQTGSASIPSATLTWKCKGTTGAPLAFFPKPTLASAINPPTFAFTRYPFGGLLIDDKILVVGRLSESKTSLPNNFNTTMNGPWACLLSGISDPDPLNWTQTYLTWPMSNESFHTTTQYGATTHPIDLGDGYITFPMQGPSRADAWAWARAPRSEVYAGNLSNLKWWAGGHWWVADPSTTDPDVGGNIRRNITGTVDFNGSDQPGGIHRRRDGQLQLTSIPYDWKVRDDPAQGAGWATSPGVGFTFDDHVEEYVVPLETAGQFHYHSMVCPGITDTGMAASDQVWAYSINGDNALTDPRAYCIKFLKVTGIDG